MSAPRRIQRRRTPGWRMPEGAIYVGRPSPYGNPFPWDADWSTWLALALGQNADEAGRRAAAVIAHRWWMANDGSPFPVATDMAEGGRGEIEYTSGAIRKISAIPVAMGVMMLEKLGTLMIPATRPSIEPLRGHDLVCWCPEGTPCHGDYLLELGGLPLPI